jgi:hypothetical protein
MRACQPAADLALTDAITRTFTAVFFIASLSEVVTEALLISFTSSVP